jgi:hypothetical protein
VAARGTLYIFPCPKIDETQLDGINPFIKYPMSANPKNITVNRFPVVKLSFKNDCKVTLACRVDFISSQQDWGRTDF